FLDSDRQYSCAYFEEPVHTLEDAQRAKKRHIAAKLLLGLGHRVLDIGCGWGGLALYMAEIGGAGTVKGITLSDEQLAVARRRAAQRGLGSAVSFELEDYRETQGQFDRIVSVGMFEHVGAKHYDEFFAKCRELLTDDGVMLLHTIGKLGGAGTPDPFTDKWIFPGYHLPSLSQMCSSSEKVKMIVSDVETLRLHYAYTLRHWLERATKAREKIIKMYDERFFRMWEFYLAGGIVMFESGAACNFQVQYVRDRRAIPITRDYMFDTERKYREIGDGPVAPKKPRSPARKKDLEPTGA
ncbi:MAG: class I SAM-dependent methyltransferase, partial [Sphingomicrobium sp.]